MCTQQKTRKGDDRMATMLTVSLYPGMSLQNAAVSNTVHFRKWIREARKGRFNYFWGFSGLLLRGFIQL